MIAFRAHDDIDAEMLRLRRDLVAFVVDELARTDPNAAVHPLAGPVADAIAQTAAAATRAELIRLGHSLADEVHLALAPQLDAGIAVQVQSGVKAGVAAALAEHAARNTAPPAWAIWALLAANGLALVAGLAAVLT